MSDRTRVLIAAVVLCTPALLLAMFALGGVYAYNPAARPVFWMLAVIVAAGLLVAGGEYLLGRYLRRISEFVTDALDWLDGVLKAIGSCWRRAVTKEQEAFALDLGAVLFFWLPYGLAVLACRAVADAWTRSEPTRAKVEAWRAARAWEVRQYTATVADEILVESAHARCTLAALVGWIAAQTKGADGVGAAAVPALSLAPATAAVAGVAENAGHAYRTVRQMIERPVTARALTPYEEMHVRSSRQPVLTVRMAA